jgi:hypothetical protein
VFISDWDDDMMVNLMIAIKVGGLDVEPGQISRPYVACSWVWLPYNPWNIVDLSSPSYERAPSIDEPPARGTLDGLIPLHSRGHTPFTYICERRQRGCCNVIELLVVPAGLYHGRCGKGNISLLV